MVAVPDKIMDGLNAARKTLEATSDAWSHALEIATAVVVVGVLVEVVATFLEIREEHKIKPHHILTFVGAGLIALAVAVEGMVELRGGDVETSLRANNAATQSLLNDRARRATQAAVDIATKEGGLDTFIRGRVGEIDTDIASLKGATARAESLLHTVEQKERPRILTDSKMRDLENRLHSYAGTRF